MSARILILHASVGTGHKTAANALVDALKQRQVAQIMCEDALEYGYSLFKGVYASSYIELSERAPILWAYLYEQAGKDEKRLARQVRTLIERAGVKDLKGFVRDFQPDAIICTHFLPLNLLNREKRKGRLKAPLYCVVTDFTAHVIWAYRFVDGYFVGSSDVAALLANQGVDPSKIHVLGIPISPKIAEAKDAAVLRTLHRFKEGPIVTLIGSGLKEKRVREIVTSLLQRNLHATLMVIAGRNKDLEEALADLRSSANIDLKVFGFVDNLDDMIAVSDMVITKSGGLVVSEVMARAKPLVIIDPIPGQEEWNADYVVSKGAGIQLRVTQMVPATVERLLSNPPLLEALGAGAQRAGRATAAVDIVDMILAKL